MHKNPQSSNERTKRHCSCRVNTNMGVKISSTADQPRMPKTNIAILYFITIVV